MAGNLDAESLLHDLSQMGSYGRAESENEAQFPKTLYPVPEHLRAFDPDVALVLGPRGAGKTELFRAVMHFNLLPSLINHVGGVNLRLPDNASWIPAYPIGREFPDAPGLGRFYRDRGSQPHSGIDLWFAYLLRVLRDQFDENARRELEGLNNCQGGSATANFEAFLKAGDAPLLALDRLDKRLEQEGRYIFVGYDELDTFGAGDWTTQSRAITDLIAFWAAYTRRWRRVRAKIFLRTDLFDRHARSGGADLAKIAANRAEITWNDRNIHGLLIKRIANQSPELLEYCKASKLSFKTDDKLGEIPDMSLVKDAKSLFDRMVGAYMGANRNKGLSHRWIVDHVRDGRGRALPRPLVRLVEEAAKLQLDSTNPPKPPKLITPTMLRRALDLVSSDHVKSCKDEWPWIDGLKRRLTGRTVPCHRKELEQHLDSEWKDPWDENNPGVRPTMESPRDFIPYLVEVGILRSRSEDRIDAPDLFLAGLGLKRKGGVLKR